jgi:hypothetical protein
LTIVIAIIVLPITCKKNRTDSKNETDAKKSTDSLTNIVSGLRNSNADITKKLDENTIYLKRLDSIGIKRDSIRNQPIINKAIVNYIDRVNTLNQ